MRECKVLVIQAGSLPHLKKIMSQEVAGTTLCPILLPRLEEGGVCTVAFTLSPDWSLKDPRQAMSLVCWQGANGDGVDPVRMAKHAQFAAMWRPGHGGNL